MMLQDSADAMTLEDDENAMFDPSHPEGSYALRLGITREYDLAAVLVSLSFSGASNGGHRLQNLRLNGLPIGPIDALGWPAKLPVTGMLECDFARVPGAVAKPVLDFKKLATIEREFRRATTADLTKMKVLTTLAPYSYFNTAQIVRLLKGIATGDVLVWAACVLFTRCVDLEAGGYELILGSMSERDSFYVQKALGMLGCFKGSNPTGHYELDLSTAAHRFLAVRLKDAALEEGSAMTWRNIGCDSACVLGFETAERLSPGNKQSNGALRARSEHERPPLHGCAPNGCGSGGGISADVAHHGLSIMLCNRLWKENHLKSKEFQVVSA
jgi:hypothetical protein